MGELGHLLALRVRLLASRWRRGGDRDDNIVVLLGVFSILFWLGVLGAFYFLLHVFFTYEPASGGGLGITAHALSRKLLGFILMTFFFMLFISSVINAVAQFFLSDDLQLLAPLPLDGPNFFLMRYAQTFVASAWMLFIFGLPLFLAIGIYYQIHFAAPWTYYFWMLLYFIPFLLLPCSMGVIFAMLVVNAFPAQKIRDLFVLLGVVLAGLLFVLFRLANPEQLLRGESIGDLMKLLSEIEVPSSHLLPTEWIASGLFDVLLGVRGIHAFNWALLTLTALASVAVTGWLFGRLWLDGFHKAQESRRVTFSKSSIFERVLDRFARLWPRTMGALVAKDTRAFFRDPSQWTQLLLLATLVAIYLMYYMRFPLSEIQFRTPFLKTAGAGSFIAYLNIAMTAFVMTSLGARFIYPTVSLEGRAYWLIASAPITPRQFLWSKFWIGFAPTLVVAELLIGFSNRILGADGFIHLYSMGGMFVMVFAIVALGVGLGARFPQFRAENATMVAAGYGGIVYMILAMSYVFLALFVLFFPARLYYVYERKLEMIPAMDLMECALMLGTVIIITIVMVFHAMRMGERRLARLEII